MKARIARHCYLAARAAATVAATAGCSAILAAPAASRTPPAPLTLTARAAPSLLVAVAGPGGMTPLARQVITATARPREDLDVLRAGQRNRPPLASTSPPPVRVTVPGRPVAPGPGASAYQQSHYRNALTHWRAEVGSGRRAVAARTKAALAGWARSLRLPGSVTGPPDQPAGSLPGECSLAASAVTGLVNEAGSRFRGRVVLLSVATLSGRPAPGELDGDDVIAVTSSVPGAAAASAAQLDLLAAGASFAALLGPEATPAQLDHLVSGALSGHLVSDVVSGQALFGNDSAILRPAAARVLAPLVAELRRPGASGVVNGFASTPGGRRHNQMLSLARASAVSRYLEARHVPRSSLVAVGHGSTNLVAPGFSGANRRVVVVINEPTAGRT
jgi:outer membrane protein OmpA-like peptidoglycan-associated protein